SPACSRRERLGYTDVAPQGSRMPPVRAHKTALQPRLRRTPGCDRGHKHERPRRSIIAPMTSRARSPLMYPLSAADEMTVARRRMKHLSPWRIEPIPAVHVAARSAAAAPLTGESKERY